MISSIRKNEDSFCCFRSINSNGIRVCWELLAECNLKCHHCMVYEPTRKGPDFNRKLEIANELSELNVKKVLLSGGEPFLYKRLEDICYAFTKKGILVDINTNASLFNKERLLRLLEKGVYELTISIDGSNKNTYETCRPNSKFENLINNIKLAINLGFNVDLVFVPTNLNINDLEEVANLAYNIGAKSLTIAGLIKFQTAEKNWDYLYLSDYQLIELKQRIIRLRDKTTLPIRSNRIFSSLPMNRCGAGKSVLGIDSAGYLQPCSLYILPNSNFNDLKTQNLVEIVNSEEFKLHIPNLESMDECCECSFSQRCFGGCYGAKKIANIPMKFPDTICKISYND